MRTQKEHKKSMTKKTSLNYLPVAQLFGKIYVKYMRQNVGQLSRIAQCSADGVSRIVMLHI